MITEREGVDVNAVHDQYGTPLINAVSKGCLQTVHLLLHKGANVNAQADIIQKYFVDDTINVRMEVTALYVAARLGHLLIARLLLSYGADVSVICRDRYNLQHYTILHAALSSQANAAEMVTILLEAGAVSHEDSENLGYLLSLSATKSEDVSVLSTLLASGVHPDVGEGQALQIALVNNQMDSARILIAAGADLKLCGGPFGSPLSAATRGGIEPLRFLLTEYNVDPLSCDIEGRTPLHIAAAYQNLDLIEYLLELGSEIDHEDSKGWSAIHHATAGDSIDSLKLLLARMPHHFRSPAANNWSPLHIACRRNGPDALDLLVQYGVQPTTVTTIMGKDPWNLYDIAFAYRNSKLLDDNDIPKHPILHDCMIKSVLKAPRPCFPPYDWLCDGCFPGYVSLGISRNFRDTKAIQTAPFIRQGFEQRFKCMVCPDFDYCLVCMASAEKTHPHPLSQIDSDSAEKTHSHPFSQMDSDSESW
jgi:ankyrin repeat protein